MLTWAGTVLVCAFLALPLIQLIPLPPTFWRGLPGRDTVVSAFEAAGLALPWHPLSLDPAATARSLISLLPPTAVFLAMLSLDKPGRRAVVAVVLIVSFVSVCIGFLQITSGQPYFYSFTNEGMAVGFFANGNHNAAFLACAIPYAVAWLIEFYSDHQLNRVPMMSLLLLAVIIIGVATVGSRAGLGLAFIGGLLCLAMAYPQSARRRHRFLWVAGVGFLVALFIALQFSLAGWQKRGVQQRDIVEDLRWPVAAVTLRAAQKFLPLGSGFGTFGQIYEMSVPRTRIIEYYVNHAHDDWLELSLEGGIPAVACLAGFLVWLGFASFRAWRPRDHLDVDVNLARAGSIAVMLLLMHSVVDYPTRTIAIMTVLAMSCAFLTSPSTNGDTLVRRGHAELRRDT
jgi:O-antigen ligase